VGEHDGAGAVVLNVAVHFLADFKHGLLCERGDVDVLTTIFKGELVRDVTEESRAVEVFALDPVYHFPVDEDGFEKQEVGGGALVVECRRTARGEGEVVELLLRFVEKPYVMEAEKVFDVLFKHDRGAPVVLRWIKIILLAVVKFSERPQPRATQVVCLEHAEPAYPAFAYDALVPLFWEFTPADKTVLWVVQVRDKVALVFKRGLRTYELPMETPHEILLA